MKTRILILSLLLLLAGLFIWRIEWDTAFLPARFNADMTARPAASAPPRSGAIPFGAPAAPRADVLYRQYCAACHGPAGTPPPYLANYPGMPQISDLNEEGADTSGWGESIRLGRGAMPAFAPILSDAQIEDLLQYIRNRPATPAAQSSGTAPASRPLSTHTPPPPLRLCGTDYAALLAYLLALPLGYVLVRALETLYQDKQVRFVPRLAVCMNFGGAAMLLGCVVWKDAAFVMPAFCLAAGTSVHILLHGRKEANPPRRLHTAALGVAAYAFAVPVLPGSYLPGRGLPADLLYAHGICLAALIGAAFLPHVLRRPSALTASAWLTLLTLVAAHLLLSLAL